MYIVRMDMHMCIQFPITVVSTVNSLLLTYLPQVAAIVANDVGMLTIGKYSYLLLYNVEVFSYV